MVYRNKARTKTMYASHAFEEETEELLIEKIAAFHVKNNITYEYDHYVSKLTYNDCRDFTFDELTKFNQDVVDRIEALEHEAHEDRSPAQKRADYDSDRADNDNKDK